MTANGTPAETVPEEAAEAAPESEPEQPPLPDVVRRLDSPGARELAALVGMFEELQMVLRCCERLVTELEREQAEPDVVVVEGAWTTALLSYSRCFTADGSGVVLTEDDLKEVQPTGDVVAWHRVLMQLREQHADPAVNPRERFTVGVTQDPDGAAAGVAITSAHQPLVDAITVRQTGAVGYALSGLLDARIGAQQQAVFEEVKGLSKAELDALDQLDVAAAADGT